MTELRGVCVCVSLCVCVWVRPRLIHKDKQYKIDAHVWTKVSVEISYILNVIFSIRLVIGFHVQEIQETIT